MLPPPQVTSFSLINKPMERVFEDWLGQNQGEETSEGRQYFS
jgi:hypothetical protein